MNRHLGVRLALGAIVLGMGLLRPGGLLPAASADNYTSPLLGTWANVNAATRSIVKIHVYYSSYDGTLYARTWGACSPTPCDWGSVPLSVGYSGTTAAAHYVFSFATKNVGMARVGTELQTDTYTHFTDHSGRKDYDIPDSFKYAGP